MILLTGIKEIFTMEVIGFLIGIIVPLLILLFSSKYRGIWASIWFLPLLLAGLVFASSFEVVKDFLVSQEIIVGIVTGFTILMTPFGYIHDIIISLLSLIAPGANIWQDTILVAQWFPLALYGILWILFLCIFKKRRKRRKQKRYEDDF